jgi:hypothetical protein
VRIRSQCCDTDRSRRLEESEQELKYIVYARGS